MASPHGTLSNPSQPQEFRNLGFWESLGGQLVPWGSGMWATLGKQTPASCFDKARLTFINEEARVVLLGRVFR